MQKYFYGENKIGPYFEGWYFKCQTKDGISVAFIPAMHVSKDGCRSASLQVITQDYSRYLEYPISSLSAERDVLDIVLAGNSFSEAGIRIHIEENEFSLRGEINFGAFDFIKSDIMGPFSLFSGLECAHSVFSMSHSLEGYLKLGDRLYDFSGGLGYIEGDRGRSFPASYLWTQCLWDDYSLMLSIANVSLIPILFTGCICVIKYRGKEYRLATYRGAKILHWSRTGAIIKQGKYQLEVRLLTENSSDLRAPRTGEMNRTIRESISSTVHYRFLCNGKVIFDCVANHASYEYDSTKK